MASNPFSKKSNVLLSTPMVKDVSFVQEKSIRSPSFSDPEHVAKAKNQNPTIPFRRRRHSPANALTENLQQASFSVKSPTSSSTDDTNSFGDADSTRANLEIENCSNEDAKLLLSSLELHVLCQNACTLEDLQRIMPKISVETASTQDQYGRTALHVLSENQVLAESCWCGRHQQRLSLPSSIDVAPNRGIPWNASFPSPTSAVQRGTRGFHRRTFITGSNNSLNSTNMVFLLEEPNTEMMEHLAMVVETIWKTYPPAMMTTDERGCIPFEASLHDWVNSCYSPNANFAPAASSEHHSTIRSLVQSVSAPSSMIPSFRQLKNSLTSRWINVSAIGYQNHRSANDSQRTIIQQQQLSTLDVEVGHDGLAHEIHPLDNTSRNRIMPRQVRVTAPLLSTIKMLSILLEFMADVSTVDSENATSNFATRHPRKDRGRSLLDELNYHTQRDMRSSIVHSVASIADFLKTCLFIEDQVQRNQCLETTLMRNVLLSKHSVGSGTWLTDMLQSHEKRTSDLAIDYLQIVSNTSLEQNRDDVQNETIKGTAQRPSCTKVYDNDIQSRNELYLEVSRIQNFVPSLLSLGETQIEEAATTKIVREVLDRIISRPFAVTVVFCDALFLALLIFGYRSAVHAVLLGSAPGTVLKYIYLANVGIFYFVIREIGKAISLGMITRRASVYLTFWNLIDFLTTFLALISTVAIRCGFTGLRSLCAVATGFMWLRVLSYLKGINMQLATFVLAILQIAKDLLWFVVILFVVVIMFSQMFFTLLAPNECTTNDAKQESAECSQSEYYLKVYAILLGDFGLFKRENFESIFSIFLAVFFTFATTTILLNVLIAVASDSYEKCLMRSHKLFGRARVLMIAELVSFQNLLSRRSLSNPVDNWWNRGFSCAHGWSRGSFVFFMLSSFVTVSWTIGEVLGSLMGSSYGNIWMSLGSVLVNVLLLCSIMLFLSAGASDGKVGRDEYYNSRYFEWYHRNFQSTMVHLLGSSGSKMHVDGVDHMWQGRLLYLRNEMERVANESKNDRKDMMKSVESLVEHSESRLRSELEAFQKIINARESENVQLLEMMAEILDVLRKPTRGGGTK